MAQEQLNVLKAVLNIEVVSGVSQKTQKQYEALRLTLANGYQQMVFVDQAVIYMIKGLVDAPQETTAIPTPEESEKNKKSFLDAE